MSIIVYSPKEMVIIADTFILDTKNLKNGVKSSALSNDSKIKITADKHFAYSFEETEYPECLEVIQSFLYRLERGLLKEKETMPLFEDANFNLGIMSKNHMYRVVNNKTLKRCTVHQKGEMWTNHYNYSALYMVCDLPAAEIFDVLSDINAIMHSRVSTTVSAKQLVAIKKATKAEMKAKGVVG